MPDWTTLELERKLEKIKEPTEPAKLRKKCEGYFKMENWLVDEKLKNVSGNAIKVLLVILRHAGSKAVSWPGQKLIGKLAGVSISSVKRGIAELEEEGLVMVERKARNNKYRKGAPR